MYSYTLVQGRMREGKQTYAELQKTYDKVWRDGLRVKMWDMGMRGKLWHVIRRMYIYMRSLGVLCS